MYKIKETIIVEGTYDKIKLARFIDGIIIECGGFSVFSNKPLIKTIQAVASETGIVILTDSDAAGFKIRNFIKNHVPADRVKNAYIPSVKGKEKRKIRPGKEGLLGVEGISDDIIIEALKTAGCEIDGNKKICPRGRAISKADLYASGLSGGPDSAALRRRLADELNIPLRISSNMLLDVLNRLLSYDEYIRLIEGISQKAEKCREDGL
ncbi:MAG: DUF4093 domain-containing protein [Oscillospiraceae bacterium]|nr:DUF4093 domain-containing protein [Oscillospiraceae bacterium]